MATPEPCPQEHRFSSIERRYEMLHDILKKMEDKFDAKLDMILYQVNKVAVLEEKHSNQSAALGRAFEKIGSLEKEIETLAAFKHRVDGMARMAYILWGAMGLSISAILIKLFSNGH